MENFRRTGYGALLQTCLLMGLPLPVLPNSTLNEKLSIQASATLGINEVPKMRYLSLGIGGHKNKLGADNMSLIDTVQHTSSDASPYRIFPFVVRPLDGDLTSLERERYALRRVETINAVDYAAYYLRRLDMVNVTPKLQLKVTNNNVTQTTDYTPTSANLSPVPPVIDNNGATILDGQILHAVAKLEVVFDETEASELLNAATVIYGQEDYALISELALVSGVDRIVSVPDTVNGGNFNFNEVVAAQVCNHLATLQPMKAQRNGFTLTFDVGAAEPMFSIA